MLSLLLYQYCSVSRVVILYKMREVAHAMEVVEGCHICMYQIAHRLLHKWSVGSIVGCSMHHRLSFFDGLMEV